MASPFPDYTPLVEAAVVSYWDVRSRQAQTSKDLRQRPSGAAPKTHTYLRRRR
jgi:hypothetical protein